MLQINYLAFAVPVFLLFIWLEYYFLSKDKNAILYRLLLLGISLVWHTPLTKNWYIEKLYNRVN